jgi:hypothetical protein
MMQGRFAEALKIFDGLLQLPDLGPADRERIVGKIAAIRAAIGQGDAA